MKFGAREPNKMRPKLRVWGLVDRPRTLIPRVCGVEIEFEPKETDITRTIVRYIDRRQR